MIKLDDKAKADDVTVMPW